MATAICLPQEFKIVNGSPVVTTNAEVTGDYVSLKNVISMTIVVELLQAVSHATALSIKEATAVLPSGAVTLAATQRIWKCADVSSSDALVRSTDAANIAATAGATNQILVMQVDPATLSAGFDCIAAILSASSQVTNFATITYFLQMRYKQATPPSAIID